jgi:hypothetical protein
MDLAFGLVFGFALSLYSASPKTPSPPRARVGGSLAIRYPLSAIRYPLSAIR